ncbi:MAG: hypothetical protein IH621_08785 [Krumholzibacteria bacterium]|nr:hypothetical protein [Candidatus Krumholzibacteria bacterium]
MSKTLKTLFIVAGMLALVSLGACTREITTVQQVDPGASNCFSCHSDQETWLISIERQWTESRHGEGEVAFEGTRANCAVCHSSDGFLAYLAGEEVTGYANPAPIHCFTCHAPHSEGDFGLRVTGAVALLEGTAYDIGTGNMCVRCHQSRTNVTTALVGDVSVNNRFGPHYGPQSDMLFAANMYEYDGYTYEETPYHRTMTDNGCVDCHMADTGYFTLGGHSFDMQGEVEGEIELNTFGCVGCHEDLEDLNYNGFQDSVASLMGDLEALLLAAGMINSSGTPQSGTLSADSAGALFNWRAVRLDRSLGIHNPKYIIGLLQSSIEFMQGPPVANELARGMDD